MGKTKTGQGVPSEPAESPVTDDVVEVAAEVVEAPVVEPVEEAAEETLIYDPRPDATLNMDAPAGTPIKVAAYAVPMYLGSGAFKRSK